METTQLICIGCKNVFNKKTETYNKELKRGNRNFYCSVNCRLKFSKKTRAKIVEKCCKQCQKTTFQLFSKCCNSKLFFCCRKCNLQYYAKIRSTKLTKKCCTCGKLIKKSVSHCKDCIKVIRENGWSIKTQSFTTPKISFMKQSLKHGITYGINPNCKYSNIRTYARKIISNRPKICEKCGYSKYVECCHIKPVKQFPDDTPLSVINHPDNLKWLCPNCHKELDLGLI